MTIASEITRLQWAKASAKASIENKWVTVPANATVDTYHNYIDQIEQWYVIGWALSWITITSSVSFTNFNDDDRASLWWNWALSIVNWDDLFGIISWIYRDRRGSSADLYNSVVLWIWKEPWQDFQYIKLEWEREDNVWWWWNLRILTDWTIIRFLTSYFERTRTSWSDTANYDIYDINPSAMTVVKNWTGTLNTELTFRTCPASEFWYEWFTDFSWTVPWYVNWWFGNVQLNWAYAPTFKIN